MLASPLNVEQWDLSSCFYTITYTHYIDHIFPALLCCQKAFSEGGDDPKGPFQSNQTLFDVGCVDKSRIHIFHFKNIWSDFDKRRKNIFKTAYTLKCVFLSRAEHNMPTLQFFVGGKTMSFSLRIDFSLKRLVNMDPNQSTIAVLQEAFSLEQLLEQVAVCNCSTLECKDGECRWQNKWPIVGSDTYQQEVNLQMWRKIGSIRMLYNSKKLFFQLDLLPFNVFLWSFIPVLWHNSTGVQFQIRNMQVFILPLTVWSVLTVYLIYSFHL